MSNKIWDDPQITAYALGELSGAEREKFEARLAKEPSLRQAVDQAREVMQQVTDALATEASPAGLSSVRRAAVERAMQDERPRAIASSIPTADSASHGWLKTLVLAASIMLAGGIGFAVWNGRQEMQVAKADRAANVTVERDVNLWGSDLSADAKVNLELSFKKMEQENVPERLTESLDLAPLAAKDRSDVLSAAITPAISSSTPNTTVELFRQVEQRTVPKSALNPLVVENPVALGGGRGGADGGSAGKDVVASVDNEKFGQVSDPQPAATPSVVGGVALKKGLSLAKEMEVAEAKEDRYFMAEAALGLSAISDDLVAAKAPSAVEKSKNAVGRDIFSDRGLGSGQAGDRFEPMIDNAFLRVNEAPVSTFSVDVDTASYSKVRQYLLEANQLPRPDAVRIEEMVNYFDYDYAPPVADDPHPFAVHVEVTECPWTPGNRLARIALQGRELGEKRPQSNLVFLLDVSGSMDEPNKLPLVIRGMKLLLGQLQDRDRVAIVVYAGAAGLVLESTPVNRRDRILEALERLKAGGSTNGGQGIQLAYEQARDHFIEGGVNRVILCTDGDFNVGTTGTDALVRMVENEAKGNVFLSVLGFGMGNHNDSMLEQISDRGNGNYAFIDTAAEARKVLVHQVTGTLVTIAKDVKLQIEFNPQQVSGYRLIGYENRMLAVQDFNDDKKDAGEIGAGHEVTAFYELVPAGNEVVAAAPLVDELKYQQRSTIKPAADSKELLTVKLRYKQPEGDTSTLMEKSVSELGETFASASEDLRFAASVAGFGMQLRSSPFKGSWTWNDVRKTAQNALGNDRYGLRSEFLEIVQSATNLSAK